MQPRLKILSAELVPQIIDEAFQLLMSPGIKVQLPEARALLAGAGASVEEAREVVHIPEKVARSALESVPRELFLYDKIVQFFKGGFDLGNL